MNIRDINTYLSCILLLATMCVHTSCHRKEDPIRLPESNTPISLTATSEWQTLAKAEGETTDRDTDAEAAIQTTGFNVWATWTAPEGSNYTSTSDPAVFGTNGTAVTHDETLGWTYSPLQFWHNGTYDFVAVAIPNGPAMSSTYPSVSDGIQGLLTKNDASKTFTLDFGEGGLILSGNSVTPDNQPDLMLAYSHIEKENDNADPASLNFQHMLSKVSITAVDADDRMEIDILGIKLYGNHTTARGVSYTINDTSISAPSFTLINPSTQGSPFYIKTESAEPENKLSTDPFLVYPIAGNRTIEITYSEKVAGSPASTTRSLTLSEGHAWESGQHYSYTIEVYSDRIIFDSSIKPWSYVNVPHEFQ